MSGLEGVSFRTPLGLLEEAGEEMQLISAPDITIPDYLSILQQTQYVWSLEKWVLTGLQDGYSSQPSSPARRSPTPTPSQLLPSCPPYWHMFSPPQDSPNPNPQERGSSDCSPIPKSVLSDSEDEGEEERGEEKRIPLPTSNPTSNPNPNLNPNPNPHRRRNHLQPSTRQASLSALQTSRPNPNPSPRANPNPSPSANPNPALPPPCRTHRPPNTRANTVGWIPSIKQPATALDRDPSPEERGVLGALGPEERALLEAVTGRGYPLHTAIAALQRTGQQRPEKLLSYLGACERLCGRGYDRALVEDALEMFHYSETKAAEFLRLAAWFREMGFQPGEVREALLLHDNQGDTALEELVTRMDH